MNWAILINSCVAYVVIFVTVLVVVLGVAWVIEKVTAWVYGDWR